MGLMSLVWAAGATGVALNLRYILNGLNTFFADTVNTHQFPLAAM